MARRGPVLRDGRRIGHHVQLESQHTKVLKGRNAAERVDHGRGECSLRLATLEPAINSGHSHPVSVRCHRNPWPTGGLHHQGLAGPHPEPEGGGDAREILLLLGEL